MESRKYWISFILGAAVGAVAVAAVTRSFPWCHQWKTNRHDPKVRLERLTRELDLKENQKVEVQKILEASRAKLKSLHGEAFPKFRAIHDSTKKEIRARLDPHQQTKFDKIIERFEKKMDRWSRVF